VGDINTPLSLIDRSSKQKFSKEILEINHTIGQMELTDVYRIVHPTSAQYTLISATLGNYFKIDHILGHKASLNKYKKIEITSFILFDHNAIKPELNSKTKSRNYVNNWKLNNILLSGDM
jgi:exonuclease III